MALAYLCLGSNLGDRDLYLSEARQEIARTFGSVRFSSIYETEPVEFLDQPWFLNQVAEVRTDLPPETLLEWAQSLEERMGRVRDISKGPRTLDVDILLYDDLVLLEKRLTLPHPSMVERRHVLVPLAELAPKLKIPVHDLTVEEALGRVADKAQVKPFH